MDALFQNEFKSYTSNRNAILGLFDDLNVVNCDDLYIKYNKNCSNCE